MKQKLIPAKSLRIIAGKWRSRKINFTPAPTLRPTTDRIRETLFNWLQPYIHSAKCLDLFAGSGALSFEALSRGASFVVAIDNSIPVIAELKTNAKILQTDNLETHRLNIPAELNKIPHGNFDIIFLDPPFNTNAIKDCCSELEKTNLIKEGTLIYIEAENTLNIDLTIPQKWKILKKSETKKIVYCLVLVTDVTQGM